MFDRLRSFSDTMLESFWFVPLVMVAVSQSVVIPLLVFGFDPGGWLIDLGLPILADSMTRASDGVSASGAGTVLSVIAGGMITLISIVFSLSFVALTLTSQQLGPRIIDYWLRANSTQALLGISLSAFFAALTGLLALSVTEQAGRAALLGVGVASLLGALALVSAVLFATRMSEAIRADVTVARLGDAFVEAVRESCVNPAAEEDLAAADELAALAEAQGRVIPARRAGYLSVVDLPGIEALTRKRNLRIAVLARENDYLLPGRPAALALGVRDEDESDVADALDACFRFTPRRRRTGMADFEGDALTEVALRALSPSLNDPFTAMACTDRIGEGCVALLAEGPPKRVRLDDGMAVVVAPGAGAAWLIPRLMHPIIQSAEGQPLALERLADRAGDLRRAARRPEERAAAADIIDRVARAARRLTDEADQALLHKAIEAARAG